MKKLIWMPILLSTLLLTSCGSNIRQRDWHINTLELANEYFPKYFDMIEESLEKNNIRYEKKKGEEIIEWKDKFVDKYYYTNYYISETIYYTISFDYNIEAPNYSSLTCLFVYNSAIEEEIVNLSPNYINVMRDINNLCAYNFFGTGEKYKTYYDEVKIKLQNKQFDNGSSSISVYEEKLDYDIHREVSLICKNDQFDFLMSLKDYITDINIWDK